MGPLVLAGERGLEFSGKLVHFILSRQIDTKKKNELWFQFAGQPMRFSIREFHMVTGLKCREEERSEDCEKQNIVWERLNGSHTLKDIEDVLRQTNEDSLDERFSLGMLLLIEGILLHKYSAYKFPSSNVEIAQDIQNLQNHCWGRDSYMMLLKSVKKANLEKGKYDLHGFPMALQLWLLASVPLLQSSFSAIDALAQRNGFIAQRFTKTHKPTLSQIQNIEGVQNVKVICILPSLENDGEDSISMDDEEDEDIYAIVDFVKKGYRVTKEDWLNGYVDVPGAMEEIARQSFRFSRPSEEHPQSTTDESVKAKLDNLMRVVEDGFRLMNDRLSRIEDRLENFRNERANTDGNPSSHHQSPSFQQNENDHIPPPGQYERTEMNDIPTHHPSPSVQENLADRMGSTINPNDGKKEKVHSSFNEPSFNLFSTPTEDIGEPSRPNVPVPPLDDDIGPLKKRKMTKVSPPKIGEPEQKFQRRSTRMVIPSRSTKTPFRAPRNLALSITPEVHPILDPFGSPLLHHLDKLLHWKTLRKPSHIKIGDVSVDPSWFAQIETIGASIDEEHINATLLMLCMRRDHEPAYFHNNRLPRATFMETKFFKKLYLCYNLKKTKPNNVALGEIIEVVRGTRAPHKKWFEEIDVFMAFSLFGNSNIGSELPLI